MAKSSSKSNGGGGKLLMVKELNLGDDNIDLSESPLTYGQPDAALTGKARQVIEEFENKRYNMKTEYSTFIDADGNVIENNHGGKKSVGASLKARMTADAMSHNHPREAGVLSGPLSAGDVSNFVRFHQKTYRATGKEGTYSMSKGKDFKGKELTEAYKKQSDASYAKGDAKAKALASDYRSGKLTRSEYLSKLAKANNEMLVSDHNWLLANQKTYGYSYTLERRTR
ncbi:MAG: hypothetical protein IKX20_02955 [Paludibacteraceae bacterium]|nr:hypothetical protein [Paludibacteraceae bacterium]